MSNTLFIYISIFAMAFVTHLIRILPVTLIKREITNVTLRSFLYYVPYVTLAVMTFPSILNATQTPWSALCALVVDIILAWKGKNLMVVAMAGCLVVLVMEFIPGLI